MDSTRPHHLMAKDHGELGWRSPSFDFIQFGMTHATGGYPDKDFVRPGFGYGDFGQSQRLPVFRQINNTVQNHGFHESTPLHSGTMSITVTSGGAKNRIGGPQVPVPRLVYKAEPCPRS